VPQARSISTLFHVGGFVPSTIHYTHLAQDKELFRSDGPDPQRF
jgi:hypothetical protein